MALTSVISNTVMDPSGGLLNGVRVIIRLMPSAGFRIDDGTEVARTVETVTSVGAWAIDLERNSNITPANTYYEVTEYIPVVSGGTRTWYIQVGASDQSVSAALVTPLPTAETSNFLSQAAADARYQQLGSFGVSATNVDLDGTGTAGVATSASRSDHAHAIVVPTCDLTKSAGQAINDATPTAIVFDVETVDNDGMHSGGAQTRITFNTAGRYRIDGYTAIAAGNDYTSLYGYLRKNGTTTLDLDIKINWNNAGFNPLLHVGGQYIFAVADYIEFLVYHDNTANVARNVLQADGGPTFKAVWIGAV